MKPRKMLQDTYPPPYPDCMSYCDPTCVITGICNPFVVYNPPPPPPPPPPVHHHISPYLLIFILSTLGFFVFITVNLIRAKSRESEGVNVRESGGSDVVVDDRNRADHPTWLISTVGLQQSVINSIGVVKYKRSEGLVDGTECSVCLNEFREDESLRLLPKCNHAFHVRCIDTWLKSHTNCPLCRAFIVSDSVSAQNSVNTTTQNVENETVTEEAEVEGEALEEDKRGAENSISGNPSTSRQIRGSGSSIT